MSWNHPAIAIVLFFVLLGLGSSSCGDDADAGRRQLMILPESAKTLSPVVIESVDGHAEIDLGTIRSEHTIQYRLPVLNKTEAELKIEEVKSNCGCTVGVPESHILPKESQTDFAIVFTPRRIGSAETSLYIAFKDYPDARFKIRVKSLAAPKFTVKQSVVRLTGDNREVSLTIVDNFPESQATYEKLVVESVAFRSRAEIRRSDRHTIQASAFLTDAAVNSTTPIAYYGIQCRLGEEVSESTLRVEFVDRLSVRPSILMFHRRGDLYVARVVLATTEKKERWWIEVAPRAENSAGQIGDLEMVSQGARTAIAEVQILSENFEAISRSTKFEIVTDKGIRSKGLGFLVN